MMQLTATVVEGILIVTALNVATVTHYIYIFIMQLFTTNSYFEMKVIKKKFVIVIMKLHQSHLL